MKRCTRCGDELTSANSRARSDRPGVFIAQCVKCIRELSRARDKACRPRREKRAPVPADPRRVKQKLCEPCYGMPHRRDGITCSGCGEPRLPEPKPVLRDYLYTANYMEIV